MRLAYDGAVVRTYSDDVKAQVLADAKLGLSLRELSAKHKVPKSTVETWIGAAGRAVSVPEDAHARLASLVYEYLETGLLALIAANKQHARPEVIAEAVRGGTAHEVYGAISRQVVQIFRGLELNNDDSNALPPGDSQGEAVPG